MELHPARLLRQHGNEGVRLFAANSGRGPATGRTRIGHDADPVKIRVANLGEYRGEVAHRVGIEPALVVVIAKADGNQVRRRARPGRLSSRSGRWRSWASCRDSDTCSGRCQRSLADR